MSFCTACGCERTGANHFCDGCGAEFGEPERWEDPDRVGAASLRSGSDSTRELVPGSWAGGWAAPWSYEATATRPDPDTGLLDSLLAAPDPSGDRWRDHAAADERSAGNRSSGWRKRIVIALVAVVIVAAWGGAASFELSHGHARPGARAARGSGAAAHSGAPRSAAPSAPSAASGVAVAPAAAGNTALPQVIALLQLYFSAINRHDYPAYAQLLDPQVLQLNPASAFPSGYGSTTDSGERLTGISGTDAGGVAAAVTFTSHQQPADSPDDSACDDWSITLYLVPEAGGYLIGLPPSGYQASYTSC